ncbi:MAG TPA: hypothetical protein VI386_17150, partial [Candidatus Sulfotelmatobacter sp.]
DALCGIGGTLDFVMEIAKDEPASLFCSRTIVSHPGRSQAGLEERRESCKVATLPIKQRD